MMFLTVGHSTLPPEALLNWEARRRELRPKTETLFHRSRKQSLYEVSLEREEDDQRHD
jgi:hypothetical protein